MIETLGIFFRLLLLMIALIIIGEPIRVVLSKYLRLFGRLDFLQISVLNVYLGGLILYFVAMLPFHFFNASMAWGITLIFGVLSTFLHREAFKKLNSLVRPVQKSITNVCEYFSGHKTAVLQCSAVLGIFLVTLYIQVSPLPTFIFGSIHDTSLHSLFVQVMLENRGIPLTMQPYVAEGIIYPQAAHVFFAYGCLIFGYIPPEAIFQITALFQALIILGAYYLGKSLSSRRLGLSFAFIFFCVSRWPRLLTWGGNPYVVAFPLQFILLGLIPSLQDKRKEVSKWKNNVSLFAIGILLGYLAALHLTLYIIVMATIAASIFVNMLRKRGFREMRNFSIVIAASLIPVSLFIYRFVGWYPYPGHNIGLPSDITIAPWTYVNLLSWLLFYEGISPHPPLVFIIFGLVVFSSIIIYMKRRQLPALSNPIRVSLCLFLASGILVLLFHAQYVFPPISLITGEAVRPTISIFISLCFLIGILNVILWDKLINASLKRLSHIILPSRKVFEKNLASILTFLILVSIYSPFLYYTTTQDVGYLVRSYGDFAVTTLDDYELMLWMRDNLPKNSVILVNDYEPGMFIPSVSYRRAIYPWVLSKDSSSYQKLVEMIGNGTVSPAVYDAMNQLDVTHVYVGAEYSYKWEEDRKWDPQVFLSNPNFILTKRIGNAFLFEVLFKESEAIFEDSFEYTNLYDMGWKLIDSEGYQSRGSGYVSISSSYVPYYGTHNLVIAAQNEGGIFYANGVYRTIYSWDTSNVTLGFWIDATADFSPPDALVISVWDTSWNKSLCFTTSTSLYAGHNSTIVLPVSVGLFDYNLSEIWQRTHNAMLPTTFFISIQNIDFDGVENVGYVDNISVKVGD